ncbi:FtsK/SpoIIIE domain-containing protein [Nocardia sp. BMG111209]|uniref:FtsK/SpoIIIE domain-containing protein n=1 Tax=Nocardia sp. BMG111209 TaxID=1160137 RepID=UPI0003824B40|nr:FtsK/SpoIIIE domain-containing protein [Nocardia sp. BMG111209]
MSAAELAPVLISGGSALLLAARMAFWSKSVPAQEVSSAEIAGAAPVALRAAVLTFAEPLMTNYMLASVGLASPKIGYPTLEWWDYSRHGLTAQFHMLPGQSINDWTDRATLAALSDSLGAREVTATRPDPGFVRLEVRVFDTLAVPAALPVAVHNGVGFGAVPDLEAVPLGVTENGDVWSIPVLYTHLLLSGKTGSGKSGVVQALFAGLAPAIRAGLVDLWVIDPKGGMEFGRGEKLFTRFAFATIEDILALLAEAVHELDERQARLKAAGLRKLVPTVEDPLVVVFIDEAATLSAFANRKQREQFEELHGLLLSKGRAPGFSVIETVIDPSKDTVPQRQLFPYRIGLKLSEPTQVAMIFGPGAVERGARCTEIPDSTPGVAYVEQEGSSDILRVRSFLVTDDDIDAIVQAYAPQPRPLVIDADDTARDEGDEGETGVAVAA